MRIYVIIVCKDQFDKMIESVLKSNQFTKFLDSNGIIFENEIVIGKRWIEYDDFALDDIHNRKNERSFLTKPLTEKNIKNCLIDAIKKTILCNDSEY